MSTWILVGAVVLLGPVAASLSPVLKRQPWWPWKGNRKGGA
jgi:hypothetical protein